ncbi:putative F-box/LRR-repeat protein 22 [Durio zibethinus]|uniref:F-box/LRR-repeat protein 22 n=1 Tax=Durio zibethinus TaxID=66656 RepID=A0A6P5Z8C6_DURZI|nr:putative F-box/LRR-repeat protein 22 [Durio zibethinus]
MATEPETRNWLELPLDVTASNLSRLGAFEIVCSQWRKICKEPLWRSIDMRNLGEGCRRFHSGSDEEALAIAQTMPGLCHLQLFGNKLTNDGLLAILDGCPHLESLDMHQCFNVILGGNLEKRCVEHIKYLRRPYDSTHGYEFDAEVHDTGSSDEDYPSGISAIDMMSSYDYLEFAGADDLSIMMMNTCFLANGYEVETTPSRLENQVNRMRIRWSCKFSDAIAGSTGCSRASNLSSFFFFGRLTSTDLSVANCLRGFIRS